ncbi:hypothetical protein FHU26_000632 [Clostridium beijerinckii]|nr:hypothetical protein [Clostridium beijerinckii]
MNSIVLVIIGALILILSYRFYGAFIAAKVLVLDESKKFLQKYTMMARIMFQQISGFC